jgi:hypothetical protein
MSRHLSHKAFMAVEPPIYWVRVDTGKWSSVHEKLVAEFLKKQIAGWWYRDGNIFCFGDKGDRVHFALWVKGNAFREDYGEVVVD